MANSAPDDLPEGGWAEADDEEPSPDPTEQRTQSKELDSEEQFRKIWASWRKLDQPERDQHIEKMIESVKKGLGKSPYAQVVGITFMAFYPTTTDTIFHHIRNVEAVSGAEGAAHLVKSLADDDPEALAVFIEELLSALDPEEAKALTQTIDTLTE